MFFRLLLESFRRQRRRKLLAGLAIFLGTTAITAMLALATTIGDRIHRELAVYGANIIMTPQAAALSVSIGGVDLHPATSNAFLHESDLSKLQTIFWHNNITGISPELHFAATVWPEDPTIPNPASMKPTTVPAVGLWFNHPLRETPDSPKTGAPQLHPLWKLTGHWPTNSSEAVLGATLAQQLHASVGSWYTATAGAPLDLDLRGAMSPDFKVTGIVETGNATDGMLLLPLAKAQQLVNFLSPASTSRQANGSTTGISDPVSRVEVSARTRPEDAFARKDPDTLSPKQRDLWYCRPYANSIAFQIHEAIPSARVTQLRQVEQTEGTVLSRISGLMWLIAAAALLAAAFAVSAAMATAILERRAEIGLMRSLGASRLAVATLFYVESASLALFAGVLGYLAGSSLATLLGARVFNTPNLPAAPHLATLNPVLLPIILGLALLIALAGSTPPIRSALRLDPSTTLRADA